MEIKRKTEWERESLKVCERERKSEEIVRERERERKRKTVYEIVLILNIPIERQL